ncbi:leucine-rich repeat-containing G-protein coupled receptor 5-like [Xiphias gladius]|uniref:leucine-rich repeat-containing G-protein coupled receptor 5-like n=1 Tax=Xiphias gladius TaxID=8245 RepID=UPI001A980040|nr:leucine-rich repeat-containing G-protein coupled receptor 5-like [Xiphias gladius]
MSQSRRSVLRRAAAISQYEPTSALRPNRPGFADSGKIRGRITSTRCTLSGSYRPSALTRHPDTKRHRRLLHQQLTGHQPGTVPVMDEMCSVKFCRLAGNSLSRIEKDAFTGLTGLKLLDLQNNHLTRVPSEALKNLKNLRSLHLDANFISRLPASSFRGLTSLRHLWLDDNFLTEVPVLALSSLTELQALTLALNNISFIPDRAFTALSQLLVLHLHDNRIHSLGPRSFNGLYKLETLDLSFNRINSFPTAVRSLVSLRALNLQNNHIPVVPDNAFTGNPSIETINIQNNPLHTVGHSSFQLLPELKTLSLRGSSIVEFPDFTGTNKLETLDLSHDLIQNLPSFSRCTKIQHTVSALQSDFQCCVFLQRLRSVSQQDTVDGSSLSGSSLVSTDRFSGSDLETDLGPGVFLSLLSSEVCVFVMMAAVMEGESRAKSCFQISCVVCCSLALTLPLVSVEDRGLRSLCEHSVWWTHSSALVLFNTFCFLFMILARMTRHPLHGGVSLTILLANTMLFLSASLLCLSSLLSPDVSTCAVLIISSLPCCVDPLLYMILSPRFGRELQSFLHQTPRRPKTEEEPGRAGVRDEEKAF